MSGTEQAIVKNTLSLTCITVDGAAVPYRVEAKTIPRLFAPVEEGRTLGYLTVYAATGRIIDSSPLNTVRGVAQKKEERTMGRVNIEINTMYYPFPEVKSKLCLMIEVKNYDHI